MGAFGGWEMPIEYTSIVRELLAIHNSVGVFNVSHMGEITIELGQIQYSANQQFLP